MKRNFLLMVLMFFLVISTLNTRAAHALISPVGVSVVPPLQFPFRGSSVVGLRLNLFIGVHKSVFGFDFGVVGNMTDRAFGGLQLAGIFNRNKGPATITGLQAAGIGNWNLNASNIYGLQLAPGVNYNRGRSTLVGLGIGILGNVSPRGTVVGAQLGLFNRAKQVYGFQIGLINIAEALHGIQLGLVNVNRSGIIPFFPVINIGF